METNTTITINEFKAVTGFIPDSSITRTLAVNHFPSSFEPHSPPQNGQIDSPGPAYPADRSELLTINRAFRIMDTPVNCSVCETPPRRMLAARALSRVELLFNLIERTICCSHPESEISYLNNAPGMPFAASGLLFQAVSDAVEAARQTHGYFAPVVSESGVEPDAWRRISLDPRYNTLLLQPGYRLNLCGIGLGWAIDQAYQILRSFTDFSLEAGPDRLIRGHRADGSEWYAGSNTPDRTEPSSTGDRECLCSRDLSLLHLNRGAVCSVRQVIPGATLRTEPDRRERVFSVTIIAESAARAESLARAALNAGPQAAMALIERQTGCKGLLVRPDGEVVTVGIQTT